MSNISQSIKRLYLRFSGFSYTNLARLFMRLFVGVMFIQFGIRQLMLYNQLCDTFPAVLGMSSGVTLTVMIVIELVCSLLIMVGFLTRFAAIPAAVSMIIAEWYLLKDMLPEVLTNGLYFTQPGYLPVMFLGIFLFILLAGPGKISLDYFISIFIISREGRDEKEELEEV